MRHLLRWSGFWSIWVTGERRKPGSLPKGQDARHEQVCKTCESAFPPIICLCLYFYPLYTPGFFDILVLGGHFRTARSGIYIPADWIIRCRSHQPSKLNGGDSIFHFDLNDLSILILLSYEIRAWYRILTKKWWGVKPSLFYPFGVLRQMVIFSEN